MDKLHVLIIEDDIDHAFLEEDILLDELGCSVETVKNRKEVTRRAVEGANLVLLDYNLPDATGDEVLAFIRSFSEIPVIIITGDDQLQTAVQTLKGGATDFLVKSPQNITLLPQIVQKSWEEYERKRELDRERSEKERLNTKVETLRQVLTTLAHYINNSTTTIFGYAQLCQQNDPDIKRCQKLAHISIKETKKITLVLQELENFVNTMDIKTTNYINIPDAMFAIEENLKEKMGDIK